MAFDIEFPPLSADAKTWFPWAEHKHGMIRGQLNVDVEQAVAALRDWARERAALVDLLPELDRPAAAGVPPQAAADRARHAAEIREKWARLDPEQVGGYATADRMNPAVAVRFLAGSTQAAHRRGHDTHTALSRGTRRVREGVAEMRDLRQRITASLAGGTDSAPPAPEQEEGRSAAVATTRADRPRRWRLTKGAARHSPSAARRREQRKPGRGLS
ncbi:hypothetical protein LG943_06455 [Streptomonospora sp. S1-112]|uniref:Uncharacterized protein n=1 Tax=Streptomonospora mangrovi TaxID=2883123 RepID=A0A9X3SCQ5_9ACTN|nr:hypothetical protein [Streptomonospora mangrovi]MDA0563968.1 hypothetical protein [Streptomonospora mangrovi]